MKNFKALGILALALAAFPATSSAQWLGVTGKAVNVRAGPAAEYPLVARLMRGVSISVQGCLSDYTWCDVVAGPYRGWVYASNIVYPYQGARVPVLTYGALIGIGIAAFSVDQYWDNHYRARPWYPQRQLWIERHRPVFRPDGHRPPPSVRPGHVERSEQVVRPNHVQRPSQAVRPERVQRSEAVVRPQGSPRPDRDRGDHTR